MTDGGRGWTVVGATVATQAAQAGLLVYGFSALALPLEHEFGTSRAEVMLATTCLSLASSALAPVAGHWIDKRSIKRLMLLGAAMLALGFLALSSAQAIWQVWLAYALLLPFGNVLLGQLTSAALVTRWFGTTRGRAMGLSSLGTSLGGFIFPLLLTGTALTLGWRTAAATVGGVTALAVALVIVLAVQDHPPRDTEAVAGPAPDTFGSILVRPAFWIITFAVGIKIATYFALINNLSAFGQMRGVGAIAAASLVSVLSLTSMMGKIGFGFVAERVALKFLFAGALVATIGAFVVLLLASGYPALLVACVLLGAATGGMFPLWSLLVAQQFGGQSFGRALGLTNFAMVPLTASASPIAGWAYDRFHSYDGVITGSLVFLTVATALILCLPEPREETAAS